MEENNNLNTKLFKNIVVAILITIYFIFLNLGKMNIEYNIFLTDIKVFALIILGIAIIIFENAYKENSDELALFGVEILVLACHTLSIIHVVTIFNFEFKYYILTSSYVFAIYYVLKDIIIYTIEKRKYLQSLSDIQDIVKKEKPSKKEAKKKSKDETIEDTQIKTEEIQKEEVKNKPNTKVKSKKIATSKKSTSNLEKQQEIKKETQKKNTTKANQAKKEDKVKTEEIENIDNKPKKRGRPKKKVEK